MSRRDYRFDPNREERKSKVTRDGLKKFMRLFQFVKPKRNVFIVGLVLLLLSSGVNLVFPALLGDLMDAANGRDMSEVNMIGITLMVIFALNAVISYFRIYSFAVVTQHTLALLRQTTYAHLIKLPMQFFNEKRVGELNSRISADISLLQETFTTTLAQLIRQVIIIVGGIAILTYTSYELTLFMLALVPVLSLAAVYFGRYIKNLSRETQQEVAKSGTIVEETLTAIVNVKAFANELFEIGRYKKVTDNVISVALRGAKWRGAFASFIIFALFGSISAVIWYGVYLVNQGAGISSGDLLTFIMYSLFVGGSIGGIADLYAQLQKAIGATENLMEILDEETETFFTEDSEDITIQGDVSFENVSFAYPGRKEVTVLKDLSFHVRSGDQIALVGQSGAGKSTITSLLLRFYAPEHGRILIDGKEIDSISLDKYREQIALVPQEVLLFGGTIRENIAYGKPGASDEEIRIAAEKAFALEFINSFPDGFETLVGERGIQLSGGQRQRIAIARAILRDPAILILDEATSALDAASENLVQRALVELMKNRTTFVVAHRLSTIRNADTILVLEQGSVVESGRHEELVLHEDGVYRRMNEMQVFDLTRH
jgi:ABC-type multidrug transport system fused ATPase/permease subunit